MNNLKRSDERNWALERDVGGGGGGRGNREKGLWFLKTLNMPWRKRYANCNNYF